MPVVGEYKIANGAKRAARLSQYGESVVNDVGFGRFYEACRLSRSFTAAVAGATVNTAGSVTNPVLALLSPLGGTRAAIITAVTWVPKAVGTFAAYDVALYGSAGLNGTATANVTPRCGLLGGGSSAMQCYSVVASTFTAAPTLLRPIGLGFLVTYAGSNIGVRELIDGAIIVPPGCGLAVTASAVQGAGTADVSFDYVEIDWPAI